MAMGIQYPGRIELARTPTPLEFMPRLTELFGGPEIWFKRDDLTGCALSGNKVRKLEFSLAEAMLESADVVITAGGLQSNHCRATALACARLGIPCHLILRGPTAKGEPEPHLGATKQRTAASAEGPPDGNLLLDYLAGATVSVYPRDIYAARKPQIVEELTEQYARDGRTAYWIPVGASNAIGSWGYVRAFVEIVEQCKSTGMRLDHIVTAVGSGGTMCGLLVGRSLTRRRKPGVWGVNVCDDAPTFVRDIRSIMDEMNSRFRLKLKPEETEINILDGYVGEGYAIPYPEEIELIRECARLEGELLDPVYTGKALYGLWQEIRKGRFRKGEKVIFLHTGGIFGLFPQRSIFDYAC
jgi:D-cysteine desulfhydrase